VVDVCPGDSLQPQSTTCRDAVGICDVAEKCDGIAAACPQDATEPDGSSCDSGNGVCNDGACEPLDGAAAGGASTTGHGDESDEAGCSCRLPGSAPGPSSAPWWLLTALMIVGRRQRVVI